MDRILKLTSSHLHPGSHPGTSKLYRTTPSPEHDMSGVRRRHNKRPLKNVDDGGDEDAMNDGMMMTAKELLIPCRF
eukprot:3129181-Amphidinium_carterae.1